MLISVIFGFADGRDIGWAGRFWSLMAPPSLVKVVNLLRGALYFFGLPVHQLEQRLVLVFL
jgi:hypothetical protein